MKTNGQDIKEDYLLVNRARLINILEKALNAYGDLYEADKDQLFDGGNDECFIETYELLREVLPQNKKMDGVHHDIFIKTFRAL